MTNLEHYSDDDAPTFGFETQNVLDWIKRTQPLQGAPLLVLRAWNKYFELTFNPPTCDVGLVSHSIAKVEKRSIPFRVYHPKSYDKSNPLPAIFFMHGGGWVLCDLDTHDVMCRRLCEATGHVVVSIGYRLAPEAKFPAGIEDCKATIAQVLSAHETWSISPRWAIFAGDSAGGNIAVVLCHLFRDQPAIEIVAQLLFYPSLALCYQSTYPSWKKYAGGDYLLSEQALRRTNDWYLRDDSDRMDPRVSPILFEDFTNLPPAFFALAEMDPLTDGTLHYIKKSEAAGNTVAVHTYRNVIHAFLSLGVPSKTCDLCLANASQFLADLHRNDGFFTSRLWEDVDL